MQMQISAAVKLVTHQHSEFLAHERTANLCAF